MNWQGETQSDEIEDRTGQSSSNSGIDLSSILNGLGDNTSSSVGGGSSMGGLPIPSGAFGGGIGGIVIMIILGLVLNGGLGGLFGGNSSSSTTIPTTQTQTTADENGTGDILSQIFGDQSDQLSSTSTDDSASNEKQLVAFTLNSLEKFWKQYFAENGISGYRDPALVLYSGSTMTPTGMASSDMGPFYSPSDEKIYLDPSFATELKQNYQAHGDFAMVYVIAHEFGHHIQNLLGTEAQMEKASQTMSQTQYNKLSVRLELQADYYAGMFAKWLGTQKNTANGQVILEKDDLKDALTVAGNIGDDVLMQKSAGYVNPDNFTHGTASQRQAWLEAGYDYGDLDHGDTFHASDLNNP
ncbi:MAG: neutral zinc metallopeptidase [Lactobacillaceae bacterium]|jgi:predicted metalloprotease|nr:neutral zinc metallopeptidase [Lactobacillaceae bacterium]